MNPPPARASGRIAELDALRGLSVIGIVLMNVFAFSMPAAAYYNPRAFGGTGPLDLASWSLSFVFVEDKFRNLFAMMFGAGVAILLDRGGVHPLRSHYARMAVLFAIGFLHALLLSGSDVLRLYAACGIVLPFVVRWPVRRLWGAAALLVALHLAVGGYVAWGWVEYWWRYASVPGTPFGDLQRAEIAFGADPATIGLGISAGLQPLAARVTGQLQDPLTPLVAGFVLLPLTLAAMLAGIALWRSGLLAARWPIERLHRLGWRIALIALPPLAAMAALADWSDFNAALVAANSLVWSAPFDLLLAIGWAAFAMSLFQQHALAGWVQRLAVTGRLALTNYLGTSLVLAAIFAGWGLGLFGSVNRMQAYAVALVPIALMLALSPPWLARFRQGPAEWLWRGLAAMKFAPLRR